MYSVKTKQFEGPLELLLELIGREKLDVTKISLASVTDQYLEYIEGKENITLENLAEFLSVASKLILIKSKALLPLLTLTDEEEEEIEELEHQLVEYKKFKEISKQISEMMLSRKIGYSREGMTNIGSCFYPPEDIGVADLKDIYMKVLTEIPIIEKLEEEIVREVITLEEKIGHLHDFLKEKIETSFAEIVSTAEDKVDVIVSFLAMLEMVKQRIIHVDQGELFSEIKLSKKRELV